jgi:hypothetical protein
VCCVDPVIIDEFRLVGTRDGLSVSESIKIKFKMNRFSRYRWSVSAGTEYRSIKFYMCMVGDFVCCIPSNVNCMNKSPSQTDFAKPYQKDSWSAGGILFEAFNRIMSQCVS